MLPDEMDVVEIVEPGGPEVLKAANRSRPNPESNQILIAVEAAGVNRPDVMQRRGLYPPPPGASDIPGLEIAGTVVAVGAEVETWKIGDRAAALISGGGYASFCLASASVAVPVPNGLTAIQAAAIPETFFTVWSNMFDRAGLSDGEWLLIHGGGSGIGTTAIQLAKAFGAQVAVTAGSDEKCAACRQLGADIAINYHNADFVAVIKDQTNGHGADVIIDMVGGDYVERNYAAAAPDGRIVQIALLNGTAKKVDFRRLMLKRLTHTGSTLRARPDSFKSQIAAKLIEKVWPLLEAGEVRPVIDSVFPLNEAAAAHARMESSQHVGKIMLDVAGLSG